jgi:hypothetical protein
VTNKYLHATVKTDQQYLGLVHPLHSLLSYRQLEYIGILLNLDIPYKMGPRFALGLGVGVHDF